MQIEFIKRKEMSMMKKILVLFLAFMLAFSACLILSAPVNNTLKADESYQWVKVNNGLYGGDVRSLAIDPTNSKVIYAGTYSGVFKSTNGGTNWSDIGLTNPDVWSLVIDPTFQSGKNYNIIFEPKTRETKCISAKLRHLRIPCNNSFKIVGTQKSFERHGKHLFTLRSYRKSLFKTFDGCNFWS
jgi:hypothetical protein